MGKWGHQELQVSVMIYFFILVLGGEVNPRGVSGDLSTQPPPCPVTFTETLADTMSSSEFAESVN